jgi:DNA-binding NarL/FixJ family response regulator
MPIITILVEDNKTIRDSLVPTMAQLADVEVVAVAETDVEAVTALAQHTWRLVVVDLFLKQGSGLTVLRHAANACPIRGWLSSRTTPF